MKHSRQNILDVHLTKNTKEIISTSIREKDRKETDIFFTSTSSLPFPNNKYPKCSGAHGTSWR